MNPTHQIILCAIILFLVIYLCQKVKKYLNKKQDEKVKQVVKGISSRTAGTYPYKMFVEAPKTGTNTIITANRNFQDYKSGFAKPFQQELEIKVMPVNNDNLHLVNFLMDVERQNAENQKLNEHLIEQPKPFLFDEETNNNNHNNDTINHNNHHYYHNLNNDNINPSDSTSFDSLSDTSSFDSGSSSPDF